MQRRGHVPFLAEILGAALSVLMWERLLQTEDQPIWQQGITYMGEVMFGLATADLLWSAARKITNRPEADVKLAWVKTALYCTGCLSMAFAVGVASLTGRNLDDCVAVGAALLLFAVGAFPFIHRRYGTERANS